MIVDARLSAALDEISAGLAVFDENLRLVFCNSRYSLIRGYPIELCRPGVTLAELFRYNAARGDYGNGDAELQVAERIARIRRNADVTVDQALSDGRILAASYRPLSMGGLITTYEDVTEMRRAELTLRRDQARYEQVTKAVSEGLYDWNIESNDLQVSAHVTGATVVLDAEYRIRDKANVYRWVQDRGIATRDSSGRAVRLVGAVSDVTTRKNAEKALRDSEERYSLAMSAINEGVYDWDVARDEIFYSPNVREVLGFTEDEMKTPRD